jgi:lysophospholipase L1-like esterase
MNIHHSVKMLLTGLALACSTSAFAATKIMPLGDSITGSPGCWRAYLWQSLQSGGYTNIDMVGTLAPQGCSVSHDGDNEGHGGILATNMANQNQLPAWLSATKPDVVLMHLGTNDVWSNRATADILTAFTTLVGQMRASNSSMKILVAKIIPMDSAQSCSGCGDGVIALNNALTNWASGLSTSASPITLVDQWSGFSATADTSDGVHPTDAGHKKMAAKWYPALAAVLGGTTASSTAPTSSARSSTPVSVAASSLPKSSAGNSTSAPRSSVYNSSSLATTCGNSCNWYGNPFPLCVTTTSGFGYENGASCVARTTCAGQPSPYGVVSGNCISSSSSTVASSVTSSLSVASSSVQPVNHAPVAVITGGSNFSPCCSVTLSAANSTDEDGDELSYSWQVIDCGNFSNTCSSSAGSNSSNTGSNSSLSGISGGVTVTYNTPANDSSKVILTVRDGRGGVSTAIRTFSYIVETSSTGTVPGSSIRSSTPITSSQPPLSSVSPSSARSSITPSSRSSVPSSVSVGSSSSKPAAVATCTYKIVNQWSTGHQASITIKNISSSPITAWLVEWDYIIYSLKVTSSYNATVTGSDPYSAQNLSWNAIIQPGASIEFGFQVAGSGAETPKVTGNVCP